jgi:hypothetical protein
MFNPLERKEKMTNLQLVAKANMAARTKTQTSFNLMKKIAELSGFRPTGETNWNIHRGNACFVFSEEQKTFQLEDFESARHKFQILTPGKWCANHNIWGKTICNTLRRHSIAA